MATAAEIRAGIDKVANAYRLGTPTKKSKMKTAKNVSAKQTKIVAAARKRIAKAAGKPAASAAPAAKKVTRRSQLKSAVWNAKTSRYDIPNVKAKSNKKGSRSTEARLG